MTDHFDTTGQFDTTGHFNTTGHFDTTDHFNTAVHPIDDPEYGLRCREKLDATGALVLEEFFLAESIQKIVEEAAGREPEAFFADTTHNVYLTPPDPTLPPEHLFNRQIVSTKGLIADDQVPAHSPLRAIYEDLGFREFLCHVLGLSTVHPYADELSSINLHYAADGMELGWHFDNSTFAVTMLLQAPEGGGVFEYVPDLRNIELGDPGFEAVADVLDGVTPVQTLQFQPRDLVLFRGRSALHRVTPTTGSRTRLLAVLAFNDEPGIALSESALQTFYGRTN